MSGRAVFYHLTRSGLEETLLMILTRAQVAGWRVRVRGTGPARLEVLGRRLWGGFKAGGDQSPWAQFQATPFCLSQASKRCQPSCAAGAR